MKRTWVVRPREGDWTVDRQDVLAALEDAEAIQWRMGGHLIVTHERVRASELLPDGFPGEAFTRKVVIQWRDRTDARDRPEQTVPLAEPAPIEDVEAPVGAAEAPSEPPPAETPSEAPPAPQGAVLVGVPQQAAGDDLPPLRRPEVALETAQAVQPVPGDDLSSVRVA
ncbi:MAG: hypothetical protein IRZ28_17145 [Steroidobacteraceae bacterium]|nr:hypothetical protein [Steroidobacteraceae bacterium]